MTNTALKHRGGRMFFGKDIIHTHTHTQTHVPCTNAPAWFLLLLRAESSPEHQRGCAAAYRGREGTSPQGRERGGTREMTRQTQTCQRRLSHSAFRLAADLQILPLSSGICKVNCEMCCKKWRETEEGRWWRAERATCPATVINRQRWWDSNSPVCLQPHMARF